MHFYLFLLCFYNGRWFRACKKRRLQNLMAAAGDKDQNSGFGGHSSDAELLG